MRRTRQGPGQRPSRIFRQPRSPPRTRRLSRRGRPSSRGIELPCPACRLRSIRRWALRGPEDQRWTPAVVVAARGVVEHLSEEMRAVPRRPAALAEARRAVSAGPITANPAHLSQQGPRQACRLLPTPPPASASRPSQRSSTPPSLARRTGTLGAVSGPIGPLPAETVCRYVSRHAVRYVTGYVRSTTPRHAAHTVRRYVCNIVRRYAVGYVPSNLAQ